MIFALLVKKKISQYVTILHESSFINHFKPPINTKKQC